MNFTYEENEKIFNDYVTQCRKRIRNIFFSEDELEKGHSIKNDLIKQELASNETSLEEAIKIHRNNLIDIKLNHTTRIVNDVTKMALKMGLNIDFEKVLKISALLHDIARFPQAATSNSFNDRECKEFNGMYHADYGYHILYMNKKINDFKIPDKFKFAVMQPVKFHQLPKVDGDLALKFKRKEELDVNKILTGSENLNEAEKIIVATLVQMVRDVDCLDILYQNVTGEFPVVRPYVTYDVEKDTLEDISRYWGVSVKEIMDYNGMQNSDLTNKKNIKIPSENIEPSKLVVSDDIQKRFFAGEDLDLKELQNRRDWTFITGMWWRLNHLIGNINFVSNLEVVDENRVLENIYNAYPDKYKPLVERAFTFTKEVLIEKRIKENKGNIYVGEKNR